MNRTMMNVISSWRPWASRGNQTGFRAAGGRFCSAFSRAGRSGRLAFLYLCLTLCAAAVAGAADGAADLEAILAARRAAELGGGAPPSVDSANLTTNTTASAGSTNAADTNSITLRAIGGASTASNMQETNLPPFNTVDTNSPGFTNIEGNLAGVKTPPGLTRTDLQSFRLIFERNIFNPNRRPGRIAGPPRIERERAPRLRSEAFALMGTLSYEKGDFAIFEGTSSAYRQVLKPTDTIAGYKIAEITTDHVKLEGTNGLSIELPVGMEMKRNEEEDWRLSERPGSTERSSSAASSSSTTSTNPTPEGTNASSAGGGESEALRRLLEKREQELNK